MFICIPINICFFFCNLFFCNLLVERWLAISLFIRPALFVCRICCIFVIKGIVNVRVIVSLFIGSPFLCNGKLLRIGLFTQCVGAGGCYKKGQSHRHEEAEDLERLYIFIGMFTQASAPPIRSCNKPGVIRRLPTYP